MKLVDILASELKNWPSTRTGAVGQSESGSLHLNQDARHGSDFFGWTTFKFKMAEDWKTAWVTRVEWQAAVDALNQSELDAVLAKNEQLAAARSERIPDWNGEGLPPVGAICEVLWNESRMEYLITKVFGVNEHGQPIHRFDEGPKKYQYQADVLRTASGTQVFRPIRTAEQVAAEEREKAINEMVFGVCGCEPDGGNTTAFMICGFIYDAGYRKQVLK